MGMKVYSLQNSDWVIILFSGNRNVKESSFDTLKKLSQSLPAEWNGVAQIFPAARVGGFSHLAWAGFSAFQNIQNNSMHFRKGEMEWLGYVSGSFQTENALARAGVKDDDAEIVLAFMGSKNVLTKRVVNAIAQKLNISPATVSFAQITSIPPSFLFSKEIFCIEKSALAGLE